MAREQGDSLADIVFPVIVAIACLAVHASVNHWLFPGPRQRSPQRVTIVVCACTAAAAVAAAASRNGVEDIPSAALVSACVAYCYFHFFNMSETARRIRILTSIYSGVPVDERSYSFDAMLDARIDRLVMLGSLRRNDGCHAVVPGLLMAAAYVLDAWRTVLFPGGGRGGHDG